MESFEAELESMARQFLRDTLCSMGLVSTESGAVEQWKRSTGFARQYERWLAHSLRLLREPIGSVPRDGPDLPLAWGRWHHCRAAVADDDTRLTKLELLGEMVRSLPQILTARSAATSVLFPGGSVEQVERMYRGDTGTLAANRILGDVLCRYVEARLEIASPGALRILEVGAGTGGTTRYVLARLSPWFEHLGEYCYSDVSHAFLTHGRRCFAKSYPQVTYRLFDLERSPSEQKLDREHYDVVLAANVLHATSNICRSLHHVKTLLRPGGLLLLNELGGATTFLHLTFGLLKGWWAYEDDDLRLPGSPALAPESWRTVLRAQGFSSIAVSDSPCTASGQQTISAVR